MRCRPVSSEHMPSAARIIPTARTLGPAGRQQALLLHRRFGLGAVDDAGGQFVSIAGLKGDERGGRVAGRSRVHVRAALADYLRDISTNSPSSRVVRRDAK